MFEFEYDNFLDRFNGLKIVVRNTTEGHLVGYWFNNEKNYLSSEYSAWIVSNCNKVTGVNFILEVTKLVSELWYIANMDLSYPPKDDNVNSYFVGKKQEILELAKEQAGQFLLDYFQVEDMRDLVARDDFFDKQMFTS